MDNNPGDGDSGSVKIRVKSASHRCEDINITCQLSHTIKQVKEIIKEHYPLHPETEEQRLIFAGQLLEDQQVLTDIFSQPGQSSVTGGFTVHLACNSTFLRKANKAMVEEQKSEEKLIQNNSIPSQFTTTTSSSESSNGNPMGTGVPTGGVPQDILMMHQIYVQQMMQFMAQWAPGNSPILPGQWTPVPNPQLMTGFNQFNFATTTNPPNIQAPLGLHGHVPHPHFDPMMANNQQMMEPPVNQPPPAAVPAVRNNNDDPEEHPRDLLDWMYTLSRLVLILSVVYFYSNMTRFLLVIIFTALVYVFQRRPALFNVDQADVPARQNDPPIARAVGPQAPAAAMGQNPGQPNNTHDAGAGESGQSENITPPSAMDDIVPEAQAQQQQQAQQGILDLGRTFLTSLFTSLIPEMHPN